MGNDTVAVPFAIVANNRKAGVYLAETIVGAFLLRFIYPCVGHGVCFMVNIETWLKLRNELKSNSLPRHTINFSGIGAGKSLYMSRIFYPSSLACSQ